MMQKIRIGVLMGGKSGEREVSFNSGRTICDHLDATCFEIVPLFQTVKSILYRLPWQFLYRGKISDFEQRLCTDAQRITWDELPCIIDFVYIAQHGRGGEDGTLQGMLEVLGVAYHGSKVFASALGMDKIQQKVFLRLAGISVARDVIMYPYQKPKNIHEVVQRMQQAGISFPCIVKPHKEGSSLGVSLVRVQEDLLDAIAYAMHIDEKEQAVLIEETIQGMEFTCILITDPTTYQLIALPPTEIITNSKKIFDYEQKYMPGESLQRTPAYCDQKFIKKIQKISLKAASALSFRTMARIDGFLLESGDVVITDPNTFSGAAPSSFMFKQAAECGMNHTQLINHIIKTELKSYGMEKQLAMYLKEHALDQAKKLKIAVLMGGASNEKEISLESGRNVIYKLSPYKYEALPLFLDHSMKLHRLDSRMLVCNSTAEIQEYCSEKTFMRWQELADQVDFVFIALHGGQGEDGCIQGMLETLGLPYNGSPVLTSALCMDKYKTNLFLRAQGFSVPNNFFISKEAWQENQQKVLNNLLKVLFIPCIIKPHNDGCSTLVSKVHTQDQLIKAVETIFSKDKEGVLAEELIEGMELTVGLVGNDQAYALPPSHALAAHQVLSIEEKFLPGAGENQTPAALADHHLALIKSTLEQAYQILGIKGYARIDCFFQYAQENPMDEDRVIILEVNTLPALTPATCLFHQAGEIGLKPIDFIDLIVHLGLKVHASHAIDIPAISTETMPGQLIDCY